MKKLLLLCAALTPLVAAPSLRAADAPLELLSGGWPRAFFFRQAEEAAAKQKDYAAWSREFGALMGIMGKALDEEVPGRSRNIEWFTRFKHEHPTQAVLLHVNGNSRDPRFEGQRFFAGHWIYFNGSTITADVPSQPGESVIAVADPGVFQADDDAGLCLLDAQGRPDWSRSEQVEVLGVDAAAKTIRVRRGFLDTPPSAFPAGRSYAAAHCSQEPGNTRGARNRWLYNYATTCPHDAQGRQCADIAVGHLAELFRGPLAAFDGVEFDTLYHEPHIGGKRRRGADCDADGQRDAGEIGGVQVYGVGVIEFARKLRAALGEKKLILADGSFRNDGEQRATGLLNGIESEGWPDLQDVAVNDWSGGLNRQNFWRENGRAPALSYINHKFNDPDADGREKHARVGFNITRLVFAAAVCSDSAITFSLASDGSGMRSSGVWDELLCGTERRAGWLGQTRGPTVLLAEKSDDLMRGLKLNERLTGNDASLVTDGGSVKLTAKDSRASEFKVRARLDAVTGPDLQFSLTARAAAVKAHPPEMARLIHAQLVDAEGKPVSPRIMSWLGAKDFVSRFYFSTVTATPSALDLTFESSEPVWISALALHASPDALARSFEHGAVLANPSAHAVTFDLAALFPGRTFRRLHGSAGQDVTTNSGAPVGSTVTIETKDALFLIADQAR